MTPILRLSAMNIRDCACRIKTALFDEGPLTVFVEGRSVLVYQSGQHLDLKMLAHPERVIGVYTKAASIDQIAEDLRVQIRGRIAA